MEAFVIKEIFKKQGILKPGNFFKTIVFQKTYKLFKNSTFYKKIYGNIVF